MAAASSYVLICCCSFQMLSLAASYKVLSPETDAELGARFLKSLEADGGLSAAEDKALRGFQGGNLIVFFFRLETSFQDNSCIRFRTRHVILNREICWFL